MMLLKYIIYHLIIIFILCSCNSGRAKHKSSTDNKPTNQAVQNESISVDNIEKVDTIFLKEYVVEEQKNIDVDNTSANNNNVNLDSSIVSKIDFLPRRLECNNDIYIKAIDDFDDFYKINIKKQDVFIDNNELNQKVNLTDTTKLEKDKFNRGVINNLYVKKGTWMAGVTVMHGQYDSKDVEILSFIKDFDSQAKIFIINPFIGYFYKDNVSVGLKFGYQNIYAGLDNLNIDIDEDLSLDFKNLSFKEILYKTTFFHRSYVGIDKNKRFGLFNETSLSYNWGNSDYVRGNDILKQTSTKIREVNLSLNPGASVFITENICAELSFGIVGFKYRQENQTTDGVSSGWRKSSGANFKINLFNVSIGLIAFL